MSKAEFYKDALTASPNHLRQIIAKANGDDDVAVAEIGSLIFLQRKTKWKSDVFR